MKRRILLADDSVTIQKVIELTFMDEDYEVRAVSNGDEAVALLHEVDPDFVIADVHMPGANGYEVCRKAKAARPGVPVLLLVGTFEPFDEGQARSCGADSFLKKPFDSQELLQRVEELLAPSAAATQATPAVPETQMPAMMAVPSFEVPPESLPLSASAAPDFPAEPSWGSFELEAEPAPAPALSPFPQTSAPEPFDREPSFSLEPDPGYQVTEEPVFSLDGGEQSYALQEDVFGAPSELSFDDTPQDRYLPETLEDVAPAAPAPSAGFDWAAAAAPAAPAAFAPFEPEPLRFEEEPLSPTPPEPMAPSAWDLPTPEAAPELELEPEPLPAAEQPAWAAPDPTSIFAPAIDAVAAPPAPVYPPGPTAEPEPAPEPVYAAAVSAGVSAPPASNGNGRLSDDDVDRIARRMVELLGDKAVRDVAWEVIPDMAEVIIRDRLRELEAQVE